MDKMSMIFLIIVTLWICSEKGSDGISEMLRNDMKIFIPNNGQTTLNSAKVCSDIPQCSCFELPSAKGLQVDCKERNLTNIPTNLPLNTTQLVLTMNFISSIPDNIFMNYTNMTFLDLSFNTISQLGQNVFKGLENLEVLNLEMNQIRYMNTSIHSETFKPMTYLTAINLQQHLPDISKDERYPIKSLTYLKALQHLAMDGLPNQPFNEQFLKLKFLKILQLGGVQRCNITQVSRNMFKNLPNLTDLTIQGCKLKSIQNQSFIEIPKLETLNLSHNEELEFKSFANISYGLQFTNIQKLALIKIHATFGDCTILTDENLRYLHNTSLKYIFLDSNRLALFESKAVRYIPRSLIGLSLKDNKLMLGEYVIQIVIDIAFHNLFANLKNFLIASQRVNHSFKELFKHMTLAEIVNMFADHNKQKRSLQFLRKEILSGKDTDISQPVPKANIQDLSKILLLKYFGDKCRSCKNISTSIIPLPLPPNLTVADLSNLKIRTVVRPLCFCENKLQNLSLNMNTFWYWKGPLVGLNELTYLNMQWNYCERISLDFFHYLPKLQLLYISGNFLGFPLSTDSDGIIFGKLAKLKVLHMTDNKIKFLPPTIFKGLKSLRELYLQSNQLDIISWNMDHMSKLRLVDLRGNQIVTIDENVRQHWDRLASTGSFSVNLVNNSFSCNCKNLDLLKWFSETNVNFTDYDEYKCKFDNGTHGNLVHVDMISRSLTKECANYFIVILATCLAILSGLITVAAGLAYRYRWNLRYMYYSAKFKLKGYSPVNTEEADFQNDVFVSYADSEGTFVRRHLVPELENNRGLNLLVHDRDFRAGNFVNDNIMHAITTSRKTLIIMSRNFLRSKWCCYEMNMARMEGIKTGRDVVCILMKEEVPTSGLPLEIIDIISQKTYLEYPDDNQNHLQQFWDRLADAIKQ
ncbi:toll-like receptor 4 [Mercenaria mercenaria]|uniref:toll-like receptor 4 n=1 Tax=Mercenaria mercenaria TaxID=6596 RepID=UPI001E1E0E83|nr:toll-like receptor 4 [Mercenaria mercenaria]XP_045160412.1 toll-like receptor 4 [Mercenaria mercenaria]